MRAFAHPDERLHDPRFFLMRGVARPNYEVPARAAALRAGLEAASLVAERPEPARPETLLAVHDRGYLDFLREAPADWAALTDSGAEIVANVHPTPEMLAQGGRASEHVVARAGLYTADTACPIGPGTWAAALSAAGCALAAADVAAAGGTAYALCRPPGHHAYAARAGGHCYVNNAALAAEELRRAGAARVAVVDIDSHHGNGTQGIFWNRADVLTVSVHADPERYYPWYVGRSDERGAAAGEGFNLNLVLPFGVGDEEWLAALHAGLERAVSFRPDALVVALGFDASRHEPLAALQVSADGFARAAGKLSSLRLPTVITQEGGYAVDRIGGLLTRFLTAWG